MNVTPVFIGVTGLPGAGKGTVVKLCEERIRELGLRCFSYSLSDEIRYRLQEKGWQITRENMTRYGNELRSTHGHGILAQFILKRMNHDFEMYKLVPDIVLIDSIRNPGEVNKFRSDLGSQFFLLAVSAKEETIKTRFTTRQREGELSKDLHALLHAELGENNPEFGLRIGDCMDMADWWISNEGAEHDLREKVFKLVNEQVLPLLESRPG